MLQDQEDPSPNNSNSKGHDATTNFGSTAAPSTSLLATATTTTSMNSSTPTIYDGEEEDQRVYQEQRLRLTDLLHQIVPLQVSVEWTSTNNNNSSTKDDKTDTLLDECLTPLVAQLEVAIARETALPLPPLGLSWRDYRAAMASMYRLPVPYRLILVQVLMDNTNKRLVDDRKTPQTMDTTSMIPRADDEDDDYVKTRRAATDFTLIPTLVSSIYENQAALSEANIRNAKATLFLNRQKWQRRNQQLSLLADNKDNTKFNDKEWRSVNADTPFGRSKSIQSSQKQAIQKSWSLFAQDDAKDNLSMDELRDNEFVQQLLPRVTRVEGRGATEDDLDVALAILGHKKNERKQPYPPQQSDEAEVADTQTHKKPIFVLTEAPVAISGGFVIRGQNQCSSPASLVAALDDRILAHHNSNKKRKNEWNGTLLYVQDVTRRSLGSAEDDPVLLLLHKDMSPTTNAAISVGTNVVALITTLLFSIGVYAGNDAVTARLTDGPSLGDFSNVVWFYLKLLQVLIPIFVISAAHETGHWIIAARDKLSTTLPICLPAWQIPWLGTQTKLKTSPRDSTSLFDFAAAGPVFGLLTASAFLAIGLQQTAAASMEALSYYPSLPVSILRLSTLAGTVVETVLSGDGSNPGFVLLQDPATPVPLHPWAIAGFTGLLIQALELLPLGATDGGRLSLAFFGRRGHSLVGSFLWVGLLLVTLFANHTELVVTAWVIYNFVQNDPEIPCRDEITSVDLGRGALTLLLWMVATLIITPIQ